MLTALEVPGVSWADVRPLEIPDENPLEIRPVADAVVQEEFKPCPNMFPHANGKILNDEIVIIHSSGPTGKPEVFEPGVCVAYYCTMDVAIASSLTPVVDDAAGVLVRIGPLMYRW